VRVCLFTSDHSNAKSSPWRVPLSSARMYSASNDYVTQWLAEKCDTKTAKSTTSAALFVSYTQWQEFNKVPYAARITTPTAFGTRLGKARTREGLEWA
jgi:phage/plasmid-associated DNA primase